ncbi:NfeD family protein [Culicoidibacter larvae]|uniref:NfeD family protein n=1 Tax=Culicoidibacter larvae TaxID=2579976 RepID=A0A5R8QAQ8_9FIRM|nr:NfeD family protein [Culicoidibacter larvae]TLG72947.1 NfeD family protein [Culicoidibacter larvae]
MSLLFVWIAIIILAVLIDLLTSNFLFVFFAGGAIVALIAEALNLGWAVEIIAFILVSIILLVIFYPMIHKKTREQRALAQTPEQSYIGKRFILNKNLTDTLQHKIDGIYWQIKNGESTIIAAGTEVEITAVEGNKFIIKIYHKEA